MPRLVPGPGVKSHQSALAADEDDAEPRGGAILIPLQKWKLFMEPNLITTLINTLGWGGVVVWVLLYTQTKQIPRLMHTFEKEQAEVRRVAELLRVSHEAQIDRILTAHKENVEKFVGAIDRTALVVEGMVKNCASKIALASSRESD